VSDGLWGRAPADVDGLLDALAPDAARELRRAEATLWSAADPLVLELARRRLALLLGNDAELGRRRAGAPAIPRPQLDALASWPTAPGFDERQRACLGFTEQFVIDVGGVTEADRAALRATLGRATLGFVQALYVLDASQRGRMALGRLLDTRPTGAPRPESPVDDAVAPPAMAGGGCEDLWAHAEAFMRAVARCSALDPVTSELVRLRGAGQHRCRLCRSRRSLPALDAAGDPTIFDDVDRYEASTLPQRAKVALRLTDAVLTQPSTLDAALRAQVRFHFEPAEGLEIVLDVMRNAANKIAVALGADAPVVDHGVEYFTIDESGEVTAGLTR